VANKGDGSRDDLQDKTILVCNQALISIFKKLVSRKTGFQNRIRLEYSDPVLEF
jgi:hypothetical protein